MINGRDSMKKATSAFTVLIVALLFAGIITVPLGTASASSSDLKVGDKWGMGKEMNYAPNITEGIDHISGMLQSQMNMTIDELEVESKLACYVLFEVTGETDTTFTLTAKMAVQFDTSVSIYITGSLPRAGTYDVDESFFDPYSTVPKETKTMSLDIEERMGMLLTANMILDRSSMAVTNMTLVFKGALSVEADAKNIPDINVTEDAQIISYKDYDVGVEAVVGLTFYMDFAPALDLLKQPVEQGEIWYTNATTATVNGYIDGHIDAHGLTDEQKAELFTDELKNATGSTDFPISLENLNTEDGKVVNGHMGPYAIDIASMEMRSMPTSVTYVVDGVSRQYQMIQVDDGPYFLYSPSLGLFAGIQVSLDDADLEIPDEVGTVTSYMGSDMDMEPMDAETVSKKIDSIGSYTDKLAADIDGDGFNIMDFFFKVPFLGSFIAILAAVSIAILVFFMARPRKS